MIDYPAMPSQQIADFPRLLVTRISSEPRPAKRGAYLFRGLEMTRDDGGPRIFLILPETMIEFQRSDLYDFPLICWEGASVSARGLSLNNTLDDGSCIYTVTPETRLILEPYRPISVTEAVEAAACTRSADLMNRAPSDEPYWMARGSMIHSLFDDLVRSMAEGVTTDFTAALRKSLPRLIAVLPGSRVSANERAVREDAGTHFRNMKSWLDRNLDQFGSAALEMDRISSTLGLKGRADAIFHGSRGNTILELKSGRVPVDDHVLQVLAYAILFRENDESPMPDAHLLYSATGRTEKLKIPENLLTATILEGRNRAVFLKHSYTEPPKDQDERVRPTCPKKGKCFRRSPCNRFFGDPAERGNPRLQGQERRFYDTWFHALSCEQWADEGEFARVLDPNTLTDRIEQGLTFPVAKVTRCASAAQDSVSETVPIELSVENRSPEIGPRDAVMLHRGDPCGVDSVRGTVSDLQDGSIFVNLKARFWLSAGQGRESPYLPDTLDSGDWYLDKMPFSRGHDVARQALWAFLDRASPAVVHEVVEGPSHDETQADKRPRKTSAAIADNSIGSGNSDRDTELEDLCFSEGLHAELNDEQEAAIRAALQSDPFHLIHGPPGTGKTRVLSRLARICLDRGERVLVACPTNVALDRLLLSLMDLGLKKFLRVGNRSAASGEFLDALTRLGDTPVFLYDLAANITEFREFKKRVKETDLIGATAYQTASHPMFLRQRFDRVIIDEAGQLNEPLTLGPLALGERFVLGGDHLQLPPVVKHRDTTAGSSSPGAGMERSLFERLFESSPESSISRLKVQYRMNTEVQEIPSRLFYDGTLTAAPEAAARRLSIAPNPTDDQAMNRIVDPALPVVFVDVEGPESGKARPEEAAVAAGIVETLLGCGVPSHEIGVITPYRAQQRLIRNDLRERRGLDRSVSVNTVDRFQGGEKEVIILSLARSDGVTSFLADKKRLNVSLSRARSKLILLGHGPVLEEHSLFRSLLNGLERIPIQP